MLRSKGRSSYTVRRVATGVGAGVESQAAVFPQFSSSDGLISSALQEQRRFSFKYATKQQHNEMRQPFFIHEKRYGIFSNEHNIGKARRGLPGITPLYTKHMSLWETDTDATTNRFFRSYVFGQRELHQLLGRPHGFESNEAAGKQADSSYETNTDMRYKGAPRPAITNLHYEPFWNRTLYSCTAHGNQLSNPSSALTAEVLGPELTEVRDIKSVEHCKAWFDRLQYLIQQHYDAVGDIGDFKSRHTRHVHEFFVAFHDALSSFDFQDAYLYNSFAKVRPKELEDIFAIFMEMEANYVHEDFCPRCSLPYATTRFCGEGDPDTPFRKFRGRWAPHQQWGKEWYDVVTRRAEALWYRSTEDPYFGTTAHTQRQVEALLMVYIKTKQRAKAIDFLHSIRGSKEFLVGDVQITPDMQAKVDALLDSTEHQHLLTNGYEMDSHVAKYTGDAQKVPHSPLQMRVDMEMNKYRRQQREEGVVRVPPASWKLDTSAIVSYKLDPQTRRVTNWREVKEGIEKSFLSTGLPKEAYTAREWREMLYLKDRIARRAATRTQLEEERLAEEAKMQKAHARQGAQTWLAFPDQSWYRIFDATPAALKPYGCTAAGQSFFAVAKTFVDPKAVSYTDPKTNTTMLFDTTAEACRIYGDYRSGEVVRLTPAKEGGKPVEVVVVGVDTAASEDAWALCAMHTDKSLHTSEGLVSLGTDCMAIQEAYAVVERTGRVLPVSILESQKQVDEEMLGKVVGVRGGQLYVQWQLTKGSSSALDASVAVALGSPEVVRGQYKLKMLDAAEGGGDQALAEPPSWQIPFRNDFVDERLKEVEQAPFQREQWASLIKGKYTPKVKKFGYTQHTTQDDFETKEYKDRLLARQYFNNPQAFEVIPERHEPSVKFRGKWEYQRVCGLPTVDRNELENGWGEAAPISDAEVDVIEQALRDISGRRPGNYIKSPTETSSLQLNESWWAPLSFGWEQHNKEQVAFLDSSERHMIENSRLPFGGKRPPFGTTYGIGERIHEIAQDYAKGFGLGPTGHSPTHDTAHFNTLGAEEERVRRLGLGSPLVRLFNEKLGSQDVHAWVVSQCGQDDVNAKHLLLSLQEWRSQGRKPSALLCRVLNQYLKEELEMFNDGLPHDVPRLTVPSASGAAADAHSSDGNIWVDVDKTAYAFEQAAVSHRGDSDEPYIVNLVQQANAGAAGTSIMGADANYTAHMQQDVVQHFQLELARLVGEGIPPGVTADRTAKVNRGAERSSGNVVPLVRMAALAKLLRKMKVTTDNVAVVQRGMANCVEREMLEGNDFAIPVSLVMTWGGPHEVRNAAGGGPRGGARDRQQGNSSSGSTVQRLLDRGQRGQSEDKMLVQVLEDLSWANDGFATDIAYAVQRNKANLVLRQEFFNAFLPVYQRNHEKVAQVYKDYCEGKFVPNITVAMEAFILFLANVAKKPDLVQSNVPYFDVDDQKRPDGAGGSGQYTQVRLLPPHLGPFQYESTLVETIETAERFQRHGILAGPTRAPVTSFIAASSSSLSYFTNRDKELVTVTTDGDQGLLHTLKKSAHYKDIAAHPAFHFLLQEGGAAHVGLISSFNRFFYRVAPMLSFYQTILSAYKQTMPGLRAEAEAANFALARTLDSEASPSIEQEFRRNSERYWRNILEGRSAEEASLASGSARRSTADSLGGVSSRRPAQQSGRSDQREGGRAGGFDLNRIVGKKNASRTGGASNSSSSSAARSGGQTPPRSGSSSSPSPSSSSSSGRLSNLLGNLKSSGSSSSTPNRSNKGNRGKTPNTK